MSTCPFQILQEAAPKFTLLNTVIVYVGEKCNDRKIGGLVSNLATLSLA